MNISTHVPNYPPSEVSNCLPGLEYLESVDQLFVCQRVEYSELFSGFEGENRYVVKDSQGKKVRELNLFYFGNCSIGHHRIESKSAISFFKSFFFN